MHRHPARKAASRTSVRTIQALLNVALRLLVVNSSHVLRGGTIRLNGRVNAEPVYLRELVITSCALNCVVKIALGALYLKLIKLQFIGQFTQTPWVVSRYIPFGHPVMSQLKVVGLNIVV